MSCDPPARAAHTPRGTCAAIARRQLMSFGPPHCQRRGADGMLARADAMQAGTARGQGADGKAEGGGPIPDAPATVPRYRVTSFFFGGGGGPGAAFPGRRRAPNTRARAWPHLWRHGRWSSLSPSWYLRKSGRQGVGREGGKWVRAKLSSQQRKSGGRGGRLQAAVGGCTRGAKQSKPGR